jgi:multiple sugar transport system substrate-binding protein
MRQSLISRVAGLGVGLLAVSLLAACTPDGEVPPSTETTAATSAHLSVVVYGPTAVTNAYRQVIDAYTKAHQGVSADVSAYPDEAAAIKAVRDDAASGKEPDLFLSGVDNLPGLMSDQLIQPVSDLLEDRQIDFGDGYVRGAVEEYSRDLALQCMPVDYSPLVVYYNSSVVNLTAAQGDAPKPIEASQKWTMDQFVTAATMAASGGRKGIYVAPTVEQTGPFLASAGGSVVDNPDQPTSLTLSSGGSIDGLTTLLALIRDRQVALPSTTPEATAVRDFEKGKLAMILGYRDLTGELRAHSEVPFNVLPMPRIGSTQTTGESSAFCLSHGSADPTAAADLLADIVSEPAMTTLAATGYVMPTNLAVLASDAFWEPTRMPASSAVFTDQVRRIVETPISDKWPAVEQYADGRLRAVMKSGSTTPDVAILTARMKLADTVSQQMFTPPSPSATPSATASPSAE